MRVLGIVVLILKLPGVVHTRYQIHEIWTQFWFSELSTKYKNSMSFRRRIWNWKIRVQLYIFGSLPEDKNYNPKCCKQFNIYKQKQKKFNNFFNILIVIFFFLNDSQIGLNLYIRKLLHQEFSTFSSNRPVQFVFASHTTINRHLYSHSYGTWTFC